MKKMSACILILAMTIGIVSSCGKPATGSTEANDTQKAIETESTVPVHQKSHHTIKPHVHSTIMDEIMGQDMADAYDNLINAVLAGETSFECKDQETYDWVMGQDAYLLYPVVQEYIHEPYDAVSFADGVGHFIYTVPYEEFQVKLQEFDDLVVGILDEVISDDYSELEKTFALYEYICNNYTYDDDLYEQLAETPIENVSGYRCFMEKKGICQELSVAYSYLLLQVGVDATVMKGVREYDRENHQWSYVTIDGINYHIDPTYGLSEDYFLRCFMMTDEQRYEVDRYAYENFIPSTTYSQVYGFPSYKATDDRYHELWMYYFDSWNPDKNIIYYKDNDGNKMEFVYE